VRPGIPVDACRTPRAEFTAAYQGLRRTPVATRVLRANDADEAVDGGCARAQDN